MMTSTRRNFLRHAAAFGAAQCLPWAILPAMAAPAGGYKALVCVFLFGGNDGNNMIVPLDSAAYATYSGVRGTLALPSSTLLAVSPRSQGGRQFGFHPALAALAPHWQKGKLAVQCNVGTLTAPISVAEYRSNPSLRPTSLFSHSDQQMQWQTADSLHESRTGWGGRFADVVSGTSGIVPPVLSFSGSTTFGVGDRTVALALPTSGGFRLSQASGNAGTVQRNALGNLLQLDRGNRLVDSASKLMQSAMAASDLLNPVLSGPAGPALSAFNGLNSSISAQLQAVAKLIAARDALGNGRQVFFVSQGGYDTHSNQIETQQRLLADLGAALNAFYLSTEAMGVAEQVVAFTASDFARTLRPASGGGTDHAWGGHQLVLGGAVRGGEFYGQFPVVALNSPNDIDGAGRWLPTTSVDQFAAGLGSWFGVSGGDLGYALPYLSRFSPLGPGFLA